MVKHRQDTAGAVALEKPSDAARRGQCGCSTSTAAVKGWRTDSALILVSKMPGGLLVELALIFATEGAATMVMIGGRLKDTS
jgi:hypothetical protein